LPPADERSELDDLEDMDKRGEVPAGRLGDLTIMIDRAFDGVTEFLTVDHIYHKGDPEPLLSLPLPPAARHEFLTQVIDAVNALMGDWPSGGQTKAWRARTSPGRCTGRPIGLSRSPWRCPKRRSSARFRAAGVAPAAG
jgi:hypothetical protein